MAIPSRPMLKVLREYGVTSHAEIIPTGLQNHSFAPGNRTLFRSRYDIAQDRPVLLFVGRVAFEKNIGFLLKVVQHIKHLQPDILFVIAGEGPAQNSLENKVNQLGLAEHVQFIGYLDRHTELNSCYCASDIFIFSSRTETQGLVLLEAMAQGVPVVSIAEMGTRDVLREGEGVLIAREEIEDFSGKILKLLNDAELRKKLGEAGKRYAHTWSATSMAVKMQKFYQDIIVDYSS